jgi:hypothetical protein
VAIELILVVVVAVQEVGVLAVVLVVEQVVVLVAGVVVVVSLRWLRLPLYLRPLKYLTLRLMIYTTRPSMT